VGIPCRCINAFAKALLPSRRAAAGRPNHAQPQRFKLVHYSQCQRSSGPTTVKSMASLLRGRSSPICSMPMGTLTALLGYSAVSGAIACGARLDGDRPNQCVFGLQNRRRGRS
jgi:hypothetical protein